MIIRPEKSADFSAIRNVNERAFDGSAEADLVDGLRREADPFVSLVAEDAGGIVGHICFSPVEIVGAEAGADAVASGRSRPAADAPTVLGLAPMAVLPQRQRQGIGSLLVEEGLSACRKVGANAIVVLGHPAYYARFGFERADRRGFRCEYDAPPEAFMVMELTPGVLAERSGLVRYHPAFGKME